MKTGAPLSVTAHAMVMFGAVFASPCTVIGSDSPLSRFITCEAPPLPEPVRYIPVEFFDDVIVSDRTVIPDIEPDPEPVLTPEPTPEPEPEPTPEPEPEPTPEPEPVEELVPTPEPELPPEESLDEEPEPEPEPLPEPEPTRRSLSQLRDLTEREERVSTSRGTGAETQAEAQFEVVIGAQMAFCWRAPLDMPFGEELPVEINLLIGPDGNLLRRPRVLNRGQITRSGNPFWRAAMDNATRAAVDCAPYPAPPSPDDDGNQEIVLNFQLPR